MVFLFATRGGLGNQIFHLAALDKLCERRKLGVMFTHIDVACQFDWRRRGVRMSGKYETEWYRRLTRLARWKLVAHLQEGRVSTAAGLVDSGRLEHLNKGLPAVLFVEHAFLQSDEWVRPDFKDKLRFRPETLAAVEDFRKEKGIDWEYAIFVHVRRGDYLRWNVLGSGSPALPEDYYREGIDRICARWDVRHIIFITDDVDYVSETFSNVPNRHIVSGATLEDLCIMAQCASGVMSASSFSWWGAMLGPMATAPVGPENWLGWALGVPFPARIVSSRFDSISVSAAGQRVR